MKCPKCGGEVSVNDLIVWKRYNQCPYCGAIIEKMVKLK